MESASELATATEALRPLGEAKWERLGEWEVDAVRTGVRALPTKTPQGAMPFAGRIGGGEPQHRCAPDSCPKLAAPSAHLTLALNPQHPCAPELQP